MELQFQSDPQDLSWYAQVQGQMETLAATAGLSGLPGMLLPSAVVEAINNIIEHAYDNLPGGPILIRADQDAEALRVELRDRGRPMPLPLPQAHFANPDAESGRGWQIIRSVFSQVDYQRRDDENILTLACPLAAAVRPIDPTPATAGEPHEP